MVKKENNSLFLNYLIDNENKFTNICEQIDNLDFKQSETLDNLSEVLTAVEAKVLH